MYGKRVLFPASDLGEVRLTLSRRDGGEQKGRGEGSYYNNLTVHGKERF
jgi:hypothetical protein